MHKLMQSASACDASQLHSPASRQSLKSNAATAASTPTTQARRAVFQISARPFVHLKMQRSNLKLCLQMRWHGQPAFFLTHDHSRSFQDQITKDVSHPCKILTWAQVWSWCSGSSHGCQYYRRFCEVKMFELNVSEKYMLTISLPPRSFSQSSLTSDPSETLQKLLGFGACSHTKTKWPRSFLKFQLIEKNCLWKIMK